jgi:hypothetical protein
MTENEKNMKKELVIELEKSKKILENYLEIAFKKNDEVFPYEDYLETISQTIETLK